MSPDPATLDEAADDIRSMRVRGAAALARHAVHGLAAWERDVTEDAARDAAAFDPAFQRAVRRLRDTRPTAVSLANALRFVKARVDERGTADAKRHALRDAVAEFDRRSRAALEEIGRHARALVEDGGVYLTHCNSQAALIGFLEARKAGVNFEVIATETRPWRQGHLTARQLADAGVAVTLMVDSAVLQEMHRVDAVFVGCDTIAANGDVVNKVGTSAISLACRETGVPFRVCGESFKVATDVPSGAEVVIEERDAREVADPADLPGVRILNPVFDVTPASRITGILTEVGPVAPADVAAVARKAWAL